MFNKNFDTCDKNLIYSKKNLIRSIKILICSIKLLICSIKLSLIYSIRLSFDMFNENYKILLDSSAECACDLHVIIT